MKIIRDESPFDKVLDEGSSHEETVFQKNVGEAKVALALRKVTQILDVTNSKMYDGVHPI